MIFTIFVPGTPVAWKRTERNRFTGRTYHNDKDGRREGWKQAIVLAWLERFAAEGFPDGPYRVHAYFRFPRPKSHFKKNGELRSTAPAEHAGTPDLDNLIKIVLDGLVSAELIPDDSHCVEMTVSKNWASPHVYAGLYLSITPLN